MKRHRRDLEIMSDLNLTNMIDTAFVLLIVFILVAPAMNNGLNLDLPQVDGESRPAESNNTLTISIQHVNEPGQPERIVMEERRLSIDELRVTLEAKKLINRKLDVVIEADRTATYDTFAQVIGVLKQVGIESVGLATDPVDPATRATQAETRAGLRNRSNAQ